MCKYDQLKQLNFLVVYKLQLDSSVDGRQQKNNRSFKHDTEVCLRLSSVCYYSYRAGAIPWLLSSIEIDIEAFVFSYLIVIWKEQLSLVLIMIGGVEECLCY